MTTDKTATTIRSLASEMSQAFEQGGPRDDGKTFRKLKDGSPQWMTDVCHEAHADMMPDDYRYVFIENAVEAIAESDADDPDSIDNARCEIEADIYTHDLTAWLGSRADRSGYCDEAAEDQGEGFKEIIPFIQAGQVLEKEEVFQLVLSALEKLADNEDNETE